ncbi:hypothetical protein [Desulfolucanica intricata]|uniref:hypothetical protein n=1 Tax=Desulfolucanica intricata TaxID=1285191 RepID=UPI0008321A24|nr:hypothetical protein [Desulfolucanica intricata]
MNILKLPDDMLEKFCSSEMNEMHARALLMLKDHNELQQKLFNEIEECGFTGQQAVELAQQYIKDIPAKTPITNLAKSSSKKLTNLKKKWSKKNMVQRKQCRKQLQDLLNEI